MANTYIKRDLSVSETIYKWTWSAWVKRSGSFGSVNTLFKSRQDGNNWVQVYFGDGGHADELLVAGYKNGGYHYAYSTSRKFRDVNAWYHIVVNVDSSQSTAGDRVRIYVNGERETSFATSTNNLSNGDSLIFNTSDSGTGHTIGSWNTTAYFNGLMSHVHYSSGYSYAPTVFGSTDSTTGEWKINTSPSFTLGGNGYTILKDGNTITDQSSNSNDFTLGGGTLSKTEDCPSNVFCTINPLDNYYANSTMTHGNTRITTANSNRSYNTGTLGASSGKYYWEVKAVSNVGSSNGCYFGIASTNPTNDGVSTAASLGTKQYDYGYLSYDGKILSNNSYSNYGNSYTDNDIIGVAMDLDNNKLYFSKNGTWQNSGDPTSGSTGTGAISIQDPSGTVNGVYTPGLGDWWVNGFTVSFNFGNGYFGGTAVSSAGTNASNLGIFEYDVPTGYTALCTKGLNE